MSSCNHDCSNCSQNCSSRIEKVSAFKGTTIKKTIGVLSGKGGVGKSLVTSLLAIQSVRKGHKVGILDADITGPSIPKVFGLRGPLTGGDDIGIIPIETRTGIKVVSSNLLLDDPSDPIIWRGSMISSMVKQFYTDVNYGELDELYIDMPPGTGDVALTTFQSIPLDGLIIVTSPQDLVSMIVTKAVKMAKMMNIPIIGLVENMSYIECDKCHNKFEIFGKSHLEEIAKEHNLKIIAKIPLNPEVARLVDEGNLEAVKDTYIVL